MFGGQALAVPAGFGSNGLAIGAQIAVPLPLKVYNETISVMKAAVEKGKLG